MLNLDFSLFLEGHVYLFQVCFCICARLCVLTHVVYLPLKAMLV